VSEIFEVDPASVDRWEAALHAASEALADGLLVVIPTETVYGIACRPDLPEATERLFKAKRRTHDLSLPVLSPSGDTAWEVAEPNEAAAALARAFWPGPLTLVLPRSDRSKPWSLGGSSDTIAVRVPNHPLCLELMNRTGQTRNETHFESGPIAATSANLSGQAPLSTRTELVEAFGDGVAVYLMLGPGAPPPGGAASTVVDLTSESPRLLREGPLSEDAIKHAINR
jgi:L-threonylcarbamoyladenylate synthase